MKYCRTDTKQILRKNKHEEKEIKFKRRWLLGLPVIRKSERKFNKNLKIWYLSDSLYRKDDIFYESVRSHVDEGVFGAHNIERENCIHQDDMDLKEIPNLKGLILSCLDNFTTRGLYLLAMIVIGDTVKSVRTRDNLKKIIKGALLGIKSCNNSNHHQLDTCKQLFQLLTNPQHFRDGHKLSPAFRSQFFRAFVTKMLCRLQNLPSRTLIAMHRKLKGVKAPMPQLQPYKQGRSKDQLIKQVTKLSKNMLSLLDGGNELQQPLVKAMAIEELSLKLTTSFHKGFSEEFCQFSHDVKSLQNDIINAIWSIKKEVVPMSVLRDLQLLIESKATIPNRGLREAFINLLTEYLFLCDDMDSTPKALMQILNVINKGSNTSTRHVSFKEKKYIENEVDCILSVSAQTERIILGLLPDNEFDQDFDDVYIEPSEDSDNSDNADDADEDDSEFLEDKQFINISSISMGSNNEKESIGDFTPSEFCTSENILSGPLTSREQLNSDCEKLQEPKNFGSLSEIDPSGKADSCKETKPLPTSTCKNQYLAIQESCDKTSMFAYNLIGHMLEEFATTEGLDIDFRVGKQIEEAKGSMADQRSEGEQSVALEKCSSGILPIIKNVVSTVDLDCKLDLRSIKLQASNVEYDPQRFAAVIMRIRAPKTTAYISASGRMVCTGAQSEQQSKLATRKYAAIIRKMGFPAKFKDFKISGIEASCDVKFPIWLEGLADSHPAFSHEPCCFIHRRVGSLLHATFLAFGEGFKELDQGKPLIYQMKQPNMCLSIFESGKVILSGAKARDEIYSALENIYPVLAEFRKKQQWYEYSSIGFRSQLIIVKSKAF